MGLCSQGLVPLVFVGLGVVNLTWPVITRSSHSVTFQPITLYGMLMPSAHSIELCPSWTAWADTHQSSTPRAAVKPRGKFSQLQWCNGRKTCSVGWCKTTVGKEGLKNRTQGVTVEGPLLRGAVSSTSEPSATWAKSSVVEIFYEY